MLAFPSLPIRVLTIRVGVLSAPVLFLSFALYGVMLLPAESGARLVRALAQAHLAGALPGIALALAHASQQLAPKPLQSSMQLALLMLTTAILGGWVDGAAVGILCLSAAVSAYFDTYAKRFNASAIVPLRLAQAVGTIFILSAIFISSAHVNDTHFIVGRSLINLLPLAWLLVAWRKQSYSKTEGGRSFKIIGALKAYSWMAGSNAVFLLPSWLLAEYSSGRSAVLAAYSLQTAMQFAGRVSDYITVNELQGTPVRKHELAITLIIMVVVQAALLVTSTANRGDLMQAWSGVLLLSLAVSLWAVGDARLTLHSFSSQGDFGRAWKVGLYALMVTLAGCVAWAVVAGEVSQIRSALLMIGVSTLGAIVYGRYGR